MAKNKDDLYSISEAACFMMLRIYSLTFTEQAKQMQFQLSER